LTVSPFDRFPIPKRVNLNQNLGDIGVTYIVKKHGGAPRPVGVLAALLEFANNARVRYAVSVKYELEV
jgi:hypothetical protein